MGLKLLSDLWGSSPNPGGEKGALQDYRMLWIVRERDYNVIIITCCKVENVEMTWSLGQ